MRGERKDYALRARYEKCGVTLLLLDEGEVEDVDLLSNRLVTSGAPNSGSRHKSGSNFPLFSPRLCLSR